MATLLLSYGFGRISFVRMYFVEERRLCIGLTIRGRSRISFLYSVAEQHSLKIATIIILESNFANNLTIELKRLVAEIIYII